jgi:hypothetical protein
MATEFLSYLGVALYTVNVDTALAVPIVYFMSFIVCVLLREFTHGILKYSLATFFIASFSFVTYVMMLDYAPWDIILVLIIIFGGFTGLWSWLGDIIKDVKKI